MRPGFKHASMYYLTFVFVLSFVDPDLTVVHSARPPERPKGSPPPAARAKRTPKDPNAPYPHMCSLARTGAKGSRQKTQTPASVRPLLIAICA